MPDDDKEPEEKTPDEAKPGSEAEAPDEGAAPDDLKKIVDEDWKAEARRDKEKLQAKIEDDLKKKAEARAMPPADFLHFVSGIAVQVLMQLGEIENPMAGEKRVDLDSARYSIDILQMLEEKTKGNLSQDEERYLSSALHDLRMRFVGGATGGAKGAGDSEPAKPGPQPKPD